MTDTTPAFDSKAYTERSFELGAMSRDQVLGEAEAHDFPPEVYDLPADDIRSFILEAEFPGSTGPSAPPAEVPPAPTSILVIQEGGSTGEYYPNLYDNEADASQFRINCTVDGSYRTTPPVAVPADLASHPEFTHVLERILKAINDIDLAYPEPLPKKAPKP